MKQEEEVMESEEYENFLGKQDSDSAPSTLQDFLPEEEVDNNVITEHRKHWKNMPAFDNPENPCHKRVIMSFRTEEDYLEFQQLIDQKMTVKTKSAWHPKLDKTANSLLRWIEEE
jgi:hypothetical protein